MGITVVDTRRPFFGDQCMHGVAWGLVGYGLEIGLKNICSDPGVPN